MLATNSEVQSEAIGVAANLFKSALRLHYNLITDYLCIAQFLSSQMIMTVIGPLVASLYLGQPKAQKNAALAFCNLASLSDEWKLRIIDSGALVGIITLLASSDAPARRQAALILESLCKVHKLLV